MPEPCLFCIGGYNFRKLADIHQFKVIDDCNLNGVERGQVIHIEEYYNNRPSILCCMYQNATGCKQDADSFSKKKSNVATSSCFIVSTMFAKIIQCKYFLL